MKQIAGDTIILQMCTKNHNHMMVGLSKTEGFFVILGQFFPFYPSPLLTTWKIKILKKWKNHLEMSCYTCVSKITYDVCFLRLGVQQTQRFVILDHFLHFYFTNNPNIQNFEKMKKKKKKFPGDIIISHRGTINDNHIMYGSWDMECDRQNCLSFWTLFYPCTPPLTTQKIKILKEILSFYTCVP